MKRLIPVVSAMALAILLAGCTPPAVSDEAETAPASTPSSTPTPTPTTPAADGSRATPYAYGSVAHVSEESLWDFTIHTPQQDPNGWVAQADEFNDAPAEGNTWVGANIQVTVRDVPEVASASTEPISVGGSVSPVFVGASGTIYDFWTVNYPAMFAGASWNSQPDVFVSVGQQWDMPFALQVPVAELEGGSFAVRHQISGKVIFFE